MISREECRARDRDDPLAGVAARFLLPPGVIYLDGNSLGPPAATTGARMQRFVDEEWGANLVGGWRHDGWIDIGRRLGAKIAPLIGARDDEVLVVDSTTVNLYKLLHAALDLRPERKIILAADDDFPTDVYVVDAVAAARGRVVRRVTPGEMADALSDEVAVVVCSHVHYRTARIHDMAGIGGAARRAGALTLWDLSHSVGALPLALRSDGVDLAVASTYKFLNGGPGAPAIAYVARELQDRLVQPIAGWLGHREPFAFDATYLPAAGMGRLVTGTPAIAAHITLEAALDAFAGIDLAMCRRKGIALGELFLDLLTQMVPGVFTLVSPPNSALRGSHLSISHPHGYAIVQALIERDVMCDFRAPDVLRFGLAPLYVSSTQIFDAVTALAEVMRTERWRDPAFERRDVVT